MQPRPSQAPIVHTVAMATAIAVAMFGHAPVAAAQDAPLIDAVGAYNHANVMNRPRTDEGKPVKGTQGQGRTISDAGGAIPRARFDAIVADLRTQYRQRVDRDGKASADAWLKREVETLRQRYTTIED